MLWILWSASCFPYLFLVSYPPQVFGQGKVISISAPMEEHHLVASPVAKPSIRDLRSRSNSGRAQVLSGQWIDIDEVMKGRCAAGYSIDSGKNIQVRTPFSSLGTYTVSGPPR